ncbi:hypothetical protein ZIOFF_010327 [Zingiber officinale]|uniref:Disease resistance R13L4/SHOC-2-like LRR domain-containing protein n=1 Tax=Zingiber officinale TaxID=94328 RepID=A0A8J5HV82_ZINOF|nr:hypothetical protein ZIOFF_010327 [Zingiber officinale]
MSWGRSDLNGSRKWVRPTVPNSVEDKTLGSDVAHGLGATLPDSIGDLQNLEFLDTRRTLIRKLPNSIVKLQKLVYLLGGPFIGFKFPKGIRKLKRHTTFGPARAHDVHSLQEIGQLVDLHKLGIDFGGSDLSLRMLEEISVLLSKLNGSLRSLKILHWADSSLKKALDEVASPPLLLCKLMIQCRLYELPPWFASLKHVTKITLSNTRLQLEDLQVLRNLPALVYLKLGYKSFFNNDEDLVFDRGGFAQLKFLEIIEKNLGSRALSAAEIRNAPATHGAAPFPWSPSADHHSAVALFPFPIFTSASLLGLHLAKNNESNPSSSLACHFRVRVCSPQRTPLPYLCLSTSSYLRYRVGEFVNQAVVGIRFVENEVAFSV